MAIELPTTALSLAEWPWFRGQALRSGEANDDKIHGYRGLNAQVNHAYAYLTHCVDRSGPKRDRTALASTAVGYADLTGGIPVTIGQDIATLRIYADSTDALIRFKLEDGVTTVTSAVLTTTVRAQDSADLTVGATIDRTACYLHVELAVNVTLAYVYSYVIVEVPMVAGDFP